MPSCGVETQNAVAFLRPVSGLTGRGIQAQLPVWLSLCASARYDSLLRIFSSARFCSLRVEDEHDALVRTLKARSSNQHGYAAAVFPEVLLLVMKNASFKELCQGTFVALAPFGRRQVRPAQSTRDEILTVVLQHL